MFTSKRTGKEVTEALIQYMAAPVKRSVNYRAYVAGGYPANIFNEMWKLVDESKLTKDSKFALVNDIGLEGTWQLFNKGYENVTVICTNDKIYDYVLNATCYLYNINIEVILLEEVKNMKFDLIIANPPFSIGNEITKSIVDNTDFDQYVNLMPVSKYKKSQLYRHVQTLYTADDSFADAIVGESLTIAYISKSFGPFDSQDSLDLVKCDPKYSSYYSLNSTKECKYRDVLVTSIRAFGNINNTTTFAVGGRVCQDGVHRTEDCFDYHYNVLRDYDNDRIPKWGDNAYGIWAMYFNSKEEKDNFCKFWYKNKLANDLVRGLRRNGGSPKVAIPHIDFSIDRDYEQLSLDDLINILGE